MTKELRPRPRVPIEPLAERRWDDVRDRVLTDAPLARAAGRRSLPPPASARAPWAIAALAAAAVLFVLVHRDDTDDAIATGAQRWLTGDETSVASVGDVRVSLAPHTSVHAMESSHDRWIVSVEFGSAHFDVRPRGGRPPFTVEAGRTEVLVVGTAFTVAREPGASGGSVDVEHGRVRVREPSVEHLLSDGEHWPLEMTSSTTVAAPELAAPSAEPLVPSAAALAAAPDPIRSRPRVQLEPGYAEAPPPSAVIDTRPEGIAAEVVPVEPSAEPTPESEPATAPGEPLAAPPAPDPSRTAFEEAGRLEASDPARAIATYDALVQQGGRWAENSLYAEARLELEFHHAARARTLFERYLTRYPSGANAEDARDLLHTIP